MTHKERFIKTVRGESTDALPFVPRLDIWYDANRAAGTLPEKYKHASLIELTDDLGLGFHSIVPRFRDFYNEDTGAADIGLGIYRYRALPYTVTLNGAERKIEYLPGGVTRVGYSTPRGKIETAVRYDERMRADGASLSVTLERAVKSPADYGALAYIFENAEVKPDYGYFETYMNETVGGRGIAAACASVFCSPMYYLLKELVPFELFFTELYDDPSGLENLASSLARYCRKIFDVTAGCPAEVILSGANYDAAITAPPFFSKYIAPELKRQSEILHGTGKFLATHADGENSGLYEQYRGCGVDIADSVCPFPMTRHTLKEARGLLGENVTVWGGLPSVCVLEGSMGDYEFEAFLNKTMEELGSGERLVLSIADTAPPGMKFERLLKIIEKTREFGPVKTRPRV